jgi:hypothetical protein
VIAVTDGGCIIKCARPRGSKSSGAGSSLNQVAGILSAQDSGLD